VRSWRGGGIAPAASFLNTGFSARPGFRSLASFGARIDLDTDHSSLAGTERDE
jgi:hypothetical protein